MPKTSGNGDEKPELRAPERTPERSRKTTSSVAFSRLRGIALSPFLCCRVSFRNVHRTTIAIVGNAPERTGWCGDDPYANIHTLTNPGPRVQEISISHIFVYFPHGVARVRSVIRRISVHSIRIGPFGCIHTVHLDVVQVNFRGEIYCSPWNHQPERTNPNLGARLRTLRSYAHGKDTSKPLEFFWECEPQGRCRAILRALVR